MAAPPGSGRARELACASVVALALSVLFTWPLAGGFSTSGRMDTGDGRFSIWNVAWVAHALTTNPSALWDANIFYPHTGTLAYSEANIVAGIIATPMWVATHNPYATSNWTILCAFVLAAVSMFALVRRLTDNLWAAAVAGTIYAFCSYTFSHLAHIQLLMTFGPPLALLRMHKFVDAPSAGNAVWLGVAVAIQALACAYYGIYGGMIVAIGVLWFGGWAGHLRSPRVWMLTALAVAVAVVLVGPFLWQYAGIQRDGFARHLEDARTFRAGWRAYLASALLAYNWMLPLIGHWREVLFPGFLSIGLAAFTIFRAIRRPAVLKSVSRRRVVFFYVIAGVFAGWASLGPDAGLYRALYETVPFMSLLRAPSRFGLFVTLSFAVLAGVGVAMLERSWTGRYRRVCLAALVLLTLMRSTVGPLAWTAAPPTPRAVTWLGGMPRGVVAEFPFFSGRDMSQQTRYMMMSAWHWQPTLNGYSDFVPADIVADAAPLAGFPSSESLHVLRERQARYVLVHWNLYSAADQARLHSMISAMPATLQPMLNDNETSLYLLTTPTAER